MTRTAARPPRVFLGLAEIAGIYASLTDGLRELGFAADQVTLQPHPFDYQEVAGVAAARAQRWARRALALGRRLGPGRRLVAAVVRVSLLLWACARYDAFVFGGGTTFMHGWDLWLLRRLGRRTCCVFHGSDSRAPYLDGILSRGVDPAALRRATRRTKRFVKRTEGWADVVICNPLSAHLHERPVVALQHFGLPSTVEPPSAPNRAALRIVHAPSDLAGKGTERIRAAVANLHAAGYEFEYLEIVGRPNREVRDAIRGATFVVDQLYSDTTLSTFATEAASLGRVSVIGGYGLDLLPSVLGGEVPPAMYCHPADAEVAIRALLDDPAMAERFGNDARTWVRDRWGRDRVAERLARLLTDGPDPSWLYDPRELVYTHGCVIPERDLIRNIATLVAAFGASALQLDDKPDLRGRILRVGQMEPGTADA